MFALRECGFRGPTCTFHFKQAQTLKLEGNIAALVERGGNPWRITTHMRKYTLIGAELVGEVELGPHGHFGGSLIKGARGNHLAHS